MRLSCGIDIVEISRIRNALEKQGDRFKTKVFTENEISYCDARNASSSESFAAAFCAKEAVAKALGSGFGKGVEMKDIEVLHDEFGKPYIVLHKRAKEIYDKIGAEDIDISLTHCKEYAAANCVILRTINK